MAFGKKTLTLSALITLAGAASGQTYIPFLVPTAPGRDHDSSVAWGVDNNGYVVGYSYNSNFLSGAPRSTLIYHEGLVWGGGLLADCFPAGGSGYFGVSPGGVIAGSASAECSGSSRAMKSHVTTPAAVSYDQPLPGGGDCGASDANDAGMLAGWTNQVPGCDGPLCTVTTALPVLWDNGTMNLLPLGTYQVALASGVNASGAVCGYGFTADPLSYDRVKPLFWPYGALAPVTLPTVGGAFGNASKISDAGVIVGWSETAFGARHATKWVGGVATDLGALPGHGYSTAADISAAGIVGYSSVSSLNLGVATLFTPAGPMNLNGLMVASGGISLVSAEAINDNGWIACNGTYAGKSRGVLLVPANQAVFIRQFRTQTCIGGYIELEADAPAGSSPQWFFNGAPINDGPQPSGSFIIGSHDFVLSINNATLGDEGSYTCRVINPAGVATSKPATFRVCMADRNCDGAVDLVDFFEFFNAWDLQTQAADVNKDNEIDLRDFFDFFNAFDTSC